MSNPPVAATFTAEVSPALNASSLAMEQQQVEREKNKLNSDLSGIVEINIGGQSVIQVHHETLCLFPESTFASIFTAASNNHDDLSGWKNIGVSRDSKGRIFFDHDPRLIESIINYLRLKRTRILAVDTSLPPIPPPKPPEGKKEEFDFLLHYFGLYRFFCPVSGNNNNNNNNEINSGREQQQNPSEQRQEVASDTEKSQHIIATKVANNNHFPSEQVPNIISVSEEEKIRGTNIKDFTNNISASTDDDDNNEYGDDDDDAKTCPLSLDSEDDPVMGASKKRPNELVGRCSSPSKKKRKTSVEGSSTSSENQKHECKSSESSTPIVLPSNSKTNNDADLVEANAPQKYTNASRETDPSQCPSHQPREEQNKSTKKTSKKQVELRSYLEKCQKENQNPPVTNKAPWTFLPGKPVDTCTHCPACGGIFQTKNDKLQYIPNDRNQQEFDQILRHVHQRKCNMWKAYYCPRHSVYDGETDYVFSRLSTWVLTGLECVKLTVKNFSREVAIDRMKNRFAVGRYRITIMQSKASHTGLFYKNGGCKIRGLEKETYNSKFLHKILEACSDVLDELERRCMTILHHKNFSTRVTSKKMMTAVINDLNLITVSKVHAHRILEEYEKQCGIMKMTTPVKQGVEALSRSKCNLKRKSSKLAGRTIDAFLSDSDSDDELFDSGVQRLLFRTQSPSNRSSARNSASTKKDVSQSPSNKKPKKIAEDLLERSRRITIDLLSSDSESEEKNVKSSGKSCKMTPLEELQKLITRVKRSNSSTSPGSTKR